MCKNRKGDEAVKTPQDQGSVSNSLLCCPFCGGEPETKWLPEQMSVPGITVGGYVIICKECLCTSLKGAKTQDEAILFWNKRDNVSHSHDIRPSGLVVRCADCKYWEKLALQYYGRCGNKSHIRTIESQFVNKEKFVYFTSGHRCVYGKHI